MEAIIREKLKEIEEREQVRILHCVEAGSRAWGISSPDSDYDVRFIYVRSPSAYLRLEKTRDVIEWQLDDTLDISGWDLQKALRLLYKSNPTLFEWRDAPMVYHTTEAWGEISQLIPQYFQEKVSLYHYLHLARGHLKRCLQGEQVRLKKYFYVLRPLLACRWIQAHHTPPPLSFLTLMDTSLPQALRPQVDWLLHMKINAPEIALCDRIDPIHRFAEDTLADIQAHLITHHAKKKPGWQPLNQLFTAEVRETLHP